MAVVSVKPSMVAWRGGRGLGGRVDRGGGRPSTRSRRSGSARATRRPAPRRRARPRGCGGACQSPPCLDETRVYGCQCPVGAGSREPTDSRVWECRSDFSARSRSVPRRVGHRRRASRKARAGGARPRVRPGAGRAARRAGLGGGAAADLAVALRGVVAQLREAAGDPAFVVTARGGPPARPGGRARPRRAAPSVATATELLEQGRDRSLLDLLRPYVGLGGEQLRPGSSRVAGDRGADVDELGLQVAELVSSASGRQGRHAEAVTVARQAVTAHPLVERSHRALLKALATAADRSAAVVAFDHCRTVLAEELGVDPSDETVAVYLEALGVADEVGRPACPWPTRRSSAASPTWRTPGAWWPSPGSRRSSAAAAWASRGWPPRWRRTSTASRRGVVGAAGGGHRRPARGAHGGAPAGARRARRRPGGRDHRVRGTARARAPGPRRLRRGERRRGLAHHRAAGRGARAVGAGHRLAAARPGG